MKVLFVSSSIRKNIPGPIIASQGRSLQKKVELDYFTINHKGFFGYLREQFRLRRHLKAKKYDILHAHYGLSGIIAFLAKRREKLIISFMGDDLIGTPRKDGKKTLKSLLLKRIHIYLAKYFCQLCIVKSPGMHSIIPFRHTRILPNGVDLEIFCENNKHESRMRLGIKSHEKVIIFVAKPDLVQKNFHLAKSGIIHINKPEMKLLTVHGLSQNSLVHYYNAADLLLMTSFHEGSPNVIKEAMACNCPIVATYVGDIPWVTEGVEGCFLTSFDSRDVAEKIKMALDFSEIIGRTKGREKIQQLGLDSVSVAKRLISIYKDVLSN